MNVKPLKTLMEKNNAYDSILTPYVRAAGLLSHFLARRVRQHWRYTHSNEQPNSRGDACYYCDRHDCAGATDANQLPAAKYCANCGNCSPCARYAPECRLPCY